MARERIESEAILEHEGEKEELLQAAREGNTQLLREIESNNPLLLRILFTVSYLGKTPLHVAILCGHVDFARTALELCPDLAETPDSTLSLPLHLASEKGCLEIVKVLTDAKPEMCTSLNWNGLSPVHVTVAKGRMDVFEELIRVDPKMGRTRTNRDETILHMCVKNDRLQALKNIMEMRSFDDPDFINARDELGNTILHLAVAHKQIKTVKYLVRSGKLDINARNVNGQTPWDVLSQSVIRSVQDWDIGESLRDAGVTIHTQSVIRSVQDWDIGESLQDAGVTIHRTVSIKGSLNQSECSTKASLNQSEWLSKKMDALMIVASLLAAMAFQAGLNPPGGVWQDHSPSDVSGRDHHRAGEAVVAFNYRDSYNWYLRFNTISFMASLSTLLLLISGLPIKHKTPMWILMVVMWLSIISMVGTYEPREREQAPSSKLTLQRESHQLNSELLISPREKVTSRELCRKSCTTPAVELPSPRLCSETLTSISTELSISLPLKDSTLVSSSTPDPRLLSLLAISCPSTPSPKVPSSPTVRPRPETEAPSPEPPAAPPSSSVTPTMERRPESDFPPEPEEPSQEAAEP